MTFEQALNRMAALCSCSEHCESDIREKLQKAAMPVQDIDRVIDTLYAENYLNTARYCHAFARDKLRFSHWGRMKIEQGLRIKHLPPADIKEALTDLPDDEYENILQDVLKQKDRMLTDEDEYIRNGKLIRFATARGFTLDEIRHHLNL
ncbi:MAG: RecX family transcriptional regulator [Bacteroidaceae bacterium]|nr:RecX family transcriptional regulator [Bacteroidaceae bacterium]